MNPSKKERAVVFIGLHFLIPKVDLSLSARMEQDETGGGGGKKKRVKKKVLKRRGKGTSRADEGESGDSGGGTLLRPQDQVEESKSLPGSRRGSINDESKIPPVAGVFVRGIEKSGENTRKSGVNIKNLGATIKKSVKISRNKG